MSSPTLDATAAGSFPLTGSRLPWNQQIVARSWTRLTTVGIPDEVSAALDSWGSTIVVPQVAVLAFPSNEVEAVEYMAKILDLPQVSVLRALRIPKRTFHGWKGNGHQPREAVKDRIWTMTHAVAGLASLHADVATWFHATPTVAKAFRSGDSSKLTLADLEWSTENLKVLLPPVVSFDHDEDIPYVPSSSAGFVSDVLQDSAPQQRTQ